MKPKEIFLILAILLGSSTASAQCSDGQDEICIFWSLDTGDCLNCAFSEGEPIEAFVVLINASQESGVGGFEFRLVNGDDSSFPPPFIVILGYQLPPNSINVALPPQFVVGGFEPLPWSPWITLLSIDLLPLSLEPWCFGLQPPVPSSLPNNMGYVSAEPSSPYVPLIPCTGDDGYSIACLNDPGCPPPVEAEETSWGAVKGVFR